MWHIRGSNDCFSLWLPLFSLKTKMRWTGMPLYLFHPNQLVNPNHANLLEFASDCQMVLPSLSRVS